MSIISDKLSFTSKTKARHAAASDTRQMDFFPDIQAKNAAGLDVVAPQPPRLAPLPKRATENTPPLEETPVAADRPPLVAAEPAPAPLPQPVVPAPAVNPPAPRIEHREPEPPPTVVPEKKMVAEERLLRTIIGDKADDFCRTEETPPRPPDPRLAELQQDLERADATRADLEQRVAGLTAACAEVEARGQAAARELETEKRRRADEAARAVERERELTQRLNAARRSEQDLRTAHVEQHTTVAPRRLALGATALIVVVGIAAFALGRWQRPAPVKITGARPNVALKADARASRPLETAAPAPLKPVAPAWPVIAIKGVDTKTAEGAITFVFTYGVFTRGTEIAEAARQALRQLAAQLKPHLGRFRLEIEGHTDAAPVASTAPFSNNQELGLHRAQAVLDFFTRETRLPADALRATSAGDANPPYPNTTPEDRRRNRTVVLKLVPSSAL